MSMETDTSAIDIDWSDVISVEEDEKCEISVTIQKGTNVLNEFDDVTEVFAFTKADFLRRARGAWIKNGNKTSPEFEAWFELVVNAKD